MTITSVLSLLRIIKMRFLTCLQISVTISKIAKVIESYLRYKKTLFKWKI